MDTTKTYEMLCKKYSPEEINKQIVSLMNWEEFEICVKETAQYFNEQVIDD